MSDPPPAEVEAIFFDALDVPADQRDSFVRDRCGENEVLRSKVFQLLAADAAAGGEDFLESAFMNSSVTEDALDTPQVVSEQSRFKILASHQQGGLGEVLIALDQQLGRQVAIKQIKPEWQNHREANERFVQEAEVTGRLEHPGIVPVYAMGNWPDGRRFYAMRFIHGDTFKEVIERHYDPSNQIDKSARQLGLRQLLGTFTDVCNTIEYAHSRHILHRDIKPSNIMVGPYGETLVVDWGLAKLLDAPRDESMTAVLMEELNKDGGSTPPRPGGTVGTPQYMSPEQADGRWDEIGTRTDIYLLGSTLYQLLTGFPPHRDDSIKKLLPRIASGDFPRPRDLVPDVPPALEAICLKAMALEPTDRYRSVLDIAQDIERWLADEPVSVHRDSAPVRVSRWVRRHRTLAYSAAVAATLLTIGSIAGSAIWSQQQAKQFRIERENNAKALQIQVSTTNRLLELRSAAKNASDLAEKELAADRYSSAHSVLADAIKLIRGEPQLESEQIELELKADRLGRLVAFYDLSDRTHEFNMLSRDSKSITACRSGLEALGVWDKDDWWFRLPDQDLSAAQTDRLRWDVYQQWMLMDAMLVKSIGTRLTGTDRENSTSNLLPAIRRFLRTNEGKREAAAAVIISRRIELFRLSEAARWYRRAAEFRLLEGTRLAGSDLGRPRSATDAFSLAVLSMIAALDPSFELLFRDYQGPDSLLTARDLFARASTQRPNHYWTGMGLAQVEFLLAERDGGNDFRKFDPAIESVGRCIAMEPTKCFAYADRSSMYRAQAALIERLPTLEPEDQSVRAAELRRWSMADAQIADRLGSDQPWVGWQHGLALHEVGKDEEAIERFLETSMLTLTLVQTDDASFVRTDDLRGRSEVAQIADRLSQADPNDSRYLTLLASIRLNQDRFDDAEVVIKQALAGPVVIPHAYAVAGMLILSKDNVDEAMIASAIEDFRVAIEGNPKHAWAHFGLARCYESQERWDDALSAYEMSETVSRTDDHRAAALLGKSRVLGFLRRYDEAYKAIDEARRLEPACNLMTVIRPLGLHYGKWQRDSPEEALLPPMKEFLQAIIALPRVTNLQVPTSPSGHYSAALLNGDFELGSTRHWDLASNVRISKVSTHSGQYALRMTGADDRSVSQVFPVEPGRRYRVSIWVKSVSAKSASVGVNVADQTVIQWSGNAQEWTLVEGEVRISGEPADPIAEVQLQLSSPGDGAVWVDDVEVTYVGTSETF